MTKHVDLVVCASVEHHLKSIIGALPALILGTIHCFFCSMFASPVSTFRSPAKLHLHKKQNYSRTHSMSEKGETSRTLAAQRLLRAVVDLEDCSVDDLKMEAKTVDTVGQGLYATEDISPSQVLLEVPWEHILVVNASEGLPWGAIMAMNLAKMRLGSDRSHVCDLWLHTLPDRPLFPPIDCDESTLDAIRDDVVRMEALHIRADLILSYHRLVEEQPDLKDVPWADYASAASVVHGRAFCYGQQESHVIGVDLANHSFTPTAKVSIVHSPEIAQGLQAAEEVCMVEKTGPEAIFKLVAGENGIGRGDEITISYGSWSNDILFTLFGFVIPENEHDSVVVFGDEMDFMDVYQSLAAQGDDVVRDRIRQKFMEWVSSRKKGAFDRLILTCDGIDIRIHDLVRAVRILSGNSEGWASAEEVVCCRCAKLLESYTELGLPRHVEDPGVHLTQQFNILRKSLLSSAMSKMSRLPG